MAMTIRTRGNPGNIPSPSGMEFVVVRTNNCRFMLNRDEAVRLITRLDRWWAPRWVEFVDLHGSLVRLRTQAILEIFDSGPGTRFSEAALAYGMFREDRANDATLNTTEDE